MEEKLKMLAELGNEIERGEYAWLASQDEDQAEREQAFKAIAFLRQVLAHEMKLKAESICDDPENY